MSKKMICLLLEVDKKPEYRSPSTGQHDCNSAVQLSLHTLSQDRPFRQRKRPFLAIKLNSNFFQQKPTLDGAKKKVISAEYTAQDIIQIKYIENEKEIE